MRDSRETELMKAFICGFPAKHSRSPLIHNHWIEQRGLNARYEIAEIPASDFPAFVSALRDGTSGYVGGNVTIPHKETAAKLADVADDLVQEIGAANTLWVEDGRVFATNTDILGFLANLDEGHPGWNDIPSAVVFGAGGGAKSVVQGLKTRGVGEIHVVNRTLDRALEVADRFGESVHAHDMDALPEVMTGSRLFINTTSLGMKGGAVPDIPFANMAPGAIVNDLVYIPLETPIISQAKAAGLCTVDGLGMLLHQAVFGFERWFGIKPDVTADLRALVIADMERAG